MCHILSFVVGKCFWHFARPAIFDSQLLDQNRDFCLYRAMTLNSCKTVFRHTAQKWRNSFYIPDFIAADEWASYSPDLNLLKYCSWDILQDLVYEGQRLPFASLQDLKEAIKNKCKEITFETVRKSTAQRKNDWMRLESRMEVRFTTFSANRCDWISISCSETCWNYWLFRTLRTPNFTVKTKATNIIISRVVQLWLLFKNVISFCLNSVVEQYNIIAKFGTFFMIHPV